MGATTTPTKTVTAKKSYNILFLISKAHNTHILIAKITTALLYAGCKISSLFSKCYFNLSKADNIPIVLKFIQDIEQICYNLQETVGLPSMAILMHLMHK